MNKTAKVVIHILWMLGNLALLILICLSRNEIQMCSRNIYGLLVALFLFNIINPYSLFNQFLWSPIDKTFFDWRKVVHCMVIGFIGCIALSYMLDIEKNTPHCFDSTYFPKWLAWAASGHPMLYGLGQMGINVAVLHTLFVFLLPLLFSDRIRKKFREAEQEAQYKDAQQDSIIYKIKEELGNRDFDKYDLKSWGEFVRYDRISEQVQTNKGFLKEDEHLNSADEAKIQASLMKSKYTFPTNYFSKDTLKLLTILRKTDNTTLSAPLISAWLNLFIDEVSRLPNFFRVYFVVFNILYTIFLLLNDGDLIYLNIFFFGHSTYTFSNNLYSLILDPASLYREPEYIFSFLSGIGVGIISILSWLNVDRSSQMFTLTAAILVVILWVKILYSMSARESLRKFMILLEQAMIGIGPFLTVLISMILGFSFAFHIWNRNNINGSTGNLNGYGFSFYQTYSLTLGGFDLSSDPPFDVTFILIVFGAFILNIILLNILVAILGKIQDEVDQSAEGASNRLKISALMDGHRQILEHKGVDTSNQSAYLYWYAEKSNKELEEEVYDLKNDVKRMSESITRLETKMDNNMREILALLRGPR